MLNINFANNEYIDLISEFEKENFHAEAYSKDELNQMLIDNHILKDNTNIFIITHEEEFLGYIIFSITDDFTDIYKIFIRESDRNKGYATKLIEYVYNLARRYNSKKLMIEVRSENSVAIKFYEKNGFSNISIRKLYYKDPIDDALIYERKVI